MLILLWKLVLWFLDASCSSHCYGWHGYGPGQIVCHRVAIVKLSTSGFTFSPPFRTQAHRLQREKQTTGWQPKRSRGAPDKRGYSWELSPGLRCACEINRQKQHLSKGRVLNWPEGLVMNRSRRGGMRVGEKRHRNLQKRTRLALLPRFPSLAFIPNGTMRFNSSS